MLRLLLVLLFNRFSILKRNTFLRWLKYEIERSGAVFVKMAQMCSMFKDHIEDDLIDVFQGLQSGVRTEKIKFKVDNVENIDYDNPIASGSIAQVYKGTYRGLDVAIKVIRPSVLRQMRSLNAMKRYLRIMKLIAPEYKSTLNRLSYFIVYVQSQTSFSNERENIELFGKLFNDSIIVPKVYKELCTDKIIVMDLIQNYQTVYDVKDDKQESTLMISALSNAMSQMLFSHGLIHTDFQPGNVCWCSEEHKLVLFDYGAVYRLAGDVKNSLIHLNINVCMKRWQEAAQNHLQIMFENYDGLTKNEEYFRTVTEITERTLVNSESIVGIIEEVQKINKKFKDICPILRRDMFEYEMFILQITQLVGLLGNNQNFLRNVIEMSLLLTFDNLRKPENNDANDDIYLSI